MTTVGETTDSGYATSGRNYCNQVSCTLQMPANGWITNVHVDFGGHTQNPWSQLALWINGGGKLWNSAGFNAGVGRTTQSASVSGGLALGQGTFFMVGFWRDPNSDAEWGLDTADASNWSGQTAAGTTGPVEFHSNVGAFTSGSLTAWCDYVANATPNAGAWQSPTPSGTISDTNPTFSGTLPQNAADSAYETVSQIEWQMVRSTGQVYWDHVWSVNNNNTSWTQKPSDFGLSLVPGSFYSLFRYADAWGVWSPWSAASSTFTINSGPNAPTPVTPTGRTTAITGLNFTATYSHPSALAAQNVQVQVHDSSGTSLVADSGIVAQSVTSGSNFTVAQWFGTLAWSSSYTWWARAQDTGGVWGPWSTGPGTQSSGLTPFYTDSPPTTPAQVSPLNGATITSGSVVLSVLLQNPAGNNITSVSWQLFDNTAGAYVSGYNPYVTNGVYAPGSTQSLDVTSVLTSGHQYTWNATCSDGYVSSTTSGWWSFTYSGLPTVSLTAPTASQVETDAFATVSISYSGTTAKATDRTVIYDTTGGGNVLAYDSGPVAGTRTSWQLPYSTLNNGRSYTIAVTVTDANGLSATTATVPFSASWTTTAAPRMKLLINGTDMTQYWDQEQWGINQNWGRQADTSNLYLLDQHGDGGITFHVAPLSTIEVRDLNLGVVMFGGIVTDPRWLWQSPNLSKWELNCSSYAYLLQTRVLSYSYTNVTADFIARDILAQANVGITGNHIQPGPLISQMNGTNFTAASALSYLAKMASYHDTWGWWVDGNLDLHFVSNAQFQQEAIASGITFTNDQSMIASAGTATLGTYQGGDSSYYDWNATSLYNRVTVMGGAIIRSATEQFAGDGTTQSWRLSYPVNTTPLNVEVVVNNSQVNVSADAGATTPWILVQGAPGVWSLSTQPGGQPPASGAVIQIIYDYAEPVIVQAQNSDSINQFAGAGQNGGIFDEVIIDPTLTNLEAAQARALRDLGEYAYAQETTRLMTSENWPGWINVGYSFTYHNSLIPDSQNGWAPPLDDLFMVTSVRAQGLPGGYRQIEIMGVRI